MARPAHWQSPVQCISTKGSSGVEEANLNFYTERTTRVIYEASFYDDFVLVRPASSEFHTSIRQLSWSDFNSEFEEFLGDNTRLRLQLDGVNPDEEQEVEIR